MVAVVAFNELFAWFREKRHCANAFFKDFFPERLKAYKEVLGVITESGIESVDPELLPFTATIVLLEKTAEAIETVAYRNRLFIGTDIYDALLGLYMRARTTKDMLDEPIDPHLQFIDSVYLFQRDYHKLIELLREKAGVNIIDKEFANVTEGGKNIIEKDGNKADKRISGQKKRP
jgi:hypothetical protein